MTQKSQKSIPIKQQQNAFPLPYQSMPNPANPKDIWKQFSQEYDEFKRFIRNSLLNLRKELENVLFACFLHLLRLGIRTSQEDQNEKFRNFRILLDSNKNVFLNPRLIRDIWNINSSLSSDGFPITFSDYLDKFIGNGKNIVYLSQFAHECLYSFLEFEKLSTILNQLPNFLIIKKLEDPISEANYKGEFLRTALEDLDKMNTVTIPTMPNKAELDLWQALDALNKKRIAGGMGFQSSIKKSNKKSNLIKENIEMSFLTEQFKGNINPAADSSSILPLPDIKLLNRVIFCQNYLERVPLSESQQPSILQLTLTDPLENITCIEIGVNCNILLCGNLDSSIQLFLLNPTFLTDNGLNEDVINNPPIINSPNSNINNAPNNANNSNNNNNNNNLFTNPLNVPSEKGKPYFSMKFYGHCSAITSLSLHYDELYFISSSVDTSIKLWCIRSRCCLASFQAHINTVWRVRFNPKGYYFASGSSDTTAKLWTVDRASPIRVLVGHTSDVTIVEFLSNSLYLVTSGLDNKIIFWELASGNRVRILFHYQEVVTSLSLSNSGMYMMTGSEEGSVIFWDLTKFVRLNCWELEKDLPGKSGLEKKNKVNFLGFSVDESYVMAGNRKKICLYLVKNLKEKKNLDIYKDFKEEEEVESVNKPGKNEVLETNFFDNQGQDFFIAGRFHERNNIMLISKNLI